MPNVVGIDEFRSCTRCLMTHPLAAGQFRPQANGRFHTLCRNCERELARIRRQRAPRASRAAVAEAATYNRRFGIELEVHCNREVLRIALGRHALTGWRVVGDGSLNGHDGAELVSPVLQGEDGIEQCRKACLALKDAGATVRSDCGFHAHFDLAGLPAESVKRFVRSYVDNQDVFDSLVSPSRRSACYCGRWTDPEKARLDRASTIRDMARCHRTRYRTVNLWSYSAHGTVELRQHQGTTSFRKVEAWITLAMRLLEKACAGAQVPTKSNVKDLLEDVDADEDTRDYLLGRSLRLNGPTPAVAPTPSVAPRFPDGLLRDPAIRLPN